jgi:hypothetical protein
MKKNNKTLYRPELFSSKKQYPLSGLESYLGEACSVARQLTKKHTKAFRVRRSNDNAVMDIGFMNNGELDVATLMNFVGVNSGYIQLLYGCNGDILSNNNTSKEPRIVNSGILDTINNKATMVFDGLNDALWCSSTNNNDIKNQPLYISIVSLIDETYSSDGWLLVKNLDSLANMQYSVQIKNVNKQASFFIEGVSNNIASSDINSIVVNIANLLSFQWENTQMRINKNGTQNGVTDIFSGTLTSREFFTIGARQTTSSLQSAFFKGKISEIILLNGNKMQNIFDKNTMKYYSII